MGTPKHSVEIGGETFLERAVRVASPIFDEVVVVTRPEEAVDSAADRTIYDSGSDRAPIYGVARSLEDSAELRAWIMAVDYPNMTTAVLSRLVDEFESAFDELFVPVWNGEPQMLCAGWTRTLSRELQRRIEQDDLSLRPLLDGPRVRLLDEEELRQQFRGEPFANVNTPDELSEIGPESRLSHLDATGQVRMVDVADKPVTRRTASAETRVVMSPATLSLLRDDALPKGDVLATARIAGIMAAKRTSDLIPMTHPLPLEHVSIEIDVQNEGGVTITATVSCSAKTGVEIEAMVACSVAALTLYDMCKSVERGIVIERTRLISKSGGRSGDWLAEGE